MDLWRLGRYSLLCLRVIVSRPATSVQPFLLKPTTTDPSSTLTPWLHRIAFYRPPPTGTLCTAYGHMSCVELFLLDGRLGFGPIIADYCRYAANKFVWRADGSVGARIWRPFGRKCTRGRRGRVDFRVSIFDFRRPTYRLNRLGFGFWFLECRGWRDWTHWRYIAFKGLTCPNVNLFWIYSTWKFVRIYLYFHSSKHFPYSFHQHVDVSMNMCATLPL